MRDAKISIKGRGDPSKRQLTRFKGALAIHLFRTCLAVVATLGSFEDRARINHY
jgi:hypothetical protein